MLVDSHCHLSFGENAQSSLPGVLARAAENEVAYMVTVGAGEGVDGNLEAIRIAHQHPQVFCTVGIHPHDAKLFDASVEQKMAQWVKEEKVLAVGEIGLDYHYEHSPRDLQENVLNWMIEFARKSNKPIMIHDRDAGDRTYEILKSHGVKENEVMIHCFTGTKELAKKYLDLGAYLSFTGIITFKKAVELQEVVRLTPVERMLVETDSPYLAPEPFRGKKNEPAYVKHVAEAVAKLKGLNFEDVARITTLSAKRFFNLPLPSLVASVAYAIRDSLYLNITNRCTLACTFCPKFIDYEVKGYYLKLPKEPTVDEVMAQIGDPTKYKEVVFCGYGEPTRRLDALLEIAGKLKANYPNLKLRINSDGLGNLVHGRNILPELGRVIDSISVSLNAPDAQTYLKYCPNRFKEAAYPGVKAFIKEAPQYIKEVVASVVGLPDVDREACRKIAEEELGVGFRYREFNNVG